MPIKEESFRIGAGRYLQGAGYIDRLGEEVNRFGASALVVGGETALRIAGERAESSLTRTGKKYEVIVHKGTCNDERAGELAMLAKERGYEVIVGIGGGVICDFAKLIGDFAGLPVINVPTSSATCAAYTPLSVRYTPEGRTVGSRHYGYEVSGVLVDTEILVGEPVRLLLAGVFDALAKFVEIKQRYNETVQDYPLGLDYAYVMARYSYGLLNDTVSACIEDMARGHISENVERVMYTTIAATGVISGIARGSNQTALAHKFYETTRTLFPESARPYLHGEIVGVGLLLQNHFNGEERNNEALTALMKKHGMPSSVGEIGVEKSEEAFEQYYEKLSHSSAIEGEDPTERERLLQSLRYLWEL